jgi:type IV secretion system protein VirB4
MRAADDEAMSLRRDLGVAKDDVSAGRSSFGEHHLTVMVKAATLIGLDQAAADVQSAFTELGIIAVREDVNQEAAFWAQFPGNFKYIARRALISSGNFAGLASCHNFPVGQPDNNHWGPAITVLETTSAGKFHSHWSLWIGQDGGAGLPPGPGAEGAAAHGVLRQGSRRGNLPARDRRQL